MRNVEAVRTSPRKATRTNVAKRAASAVRPACNIARETNPQERRLPRGARPPHHEVRGRCEQQRLDECEGQLDEEGRCGHRPARVVSVGDLRQQVSGGSQPCSIPASNPLRHLAVGDELLGNRRAHLGEVKELAKEKTGQAAWATSRVCLQPRPSPTAA